MNRSMCDYRIFVFVGGENLSDAAMGRRAMKRKVEVTREEALVTLVLVLTGLVLVVCR